MQEKVQVDFYRGWMIEVLSLESGFQSRWCSPIGQRFRDRTLHLHEFGAWQAAIEKIDYALACDALKQFVRDIYEQERMGFAEWLSLTQSLEQVPGKF
jgi:hypothetical protein